MMKYYLAAMLCLYSCIVSSQTTIRGNVVDAQSGDPLPMVSIYISNAATGTSTDEAGHFSLPRSNDALELKISMLGYVTKIVKVPAGSTAPVSVTLEPELVNLQPVVVSGSREEQARAEVPAAISKVSSQLIQDTKATALYQLLNKVSGVYMVNLGNEQHTMAIRQPITYNALYLYMEDGIPIRPTGIFNHNALYEINMSGVQDIEVVKGPASSLYGSNAIGGAINFLTQRPSATPTLRLSLQGDNYGYKRADVAVSNTIGKLGLYAGGYAARTRDGWQDYTDMDKYSFTVRGDYRFNDTNKLTTSVTYNYLFTQTPGSLDSTRFYSREYEANQRFTYRKVEAFRASTKLEHQWSETSTTSFTLFYRNNSTGQLPSYAIKDVRVSGVYTSSNGQENNQSFQSYGVLIQHHKDLSFLNSRLIAGAYLDNAPNRYRAKFLNIDKDVANNFYTGYTNTDSLIDNYRLMLLNYALYTQYEMNPIERLHVVLGLRYDHVSYSFKNSLPADRTRLKQRQQDDYDVLAPKLGFNYDLGHNRGFYGNVSTGFQPPETTSLYGSQQKHALKQATFTNYEAGAWAAMLDRKLSFDVSLFQLDGRNEIVSVLQPDNTTQYENVGATRHQGVEYTVTYMPSTTWSIRMSGTNARHTYREFSEVRTVNGQPATFSFDGNRMNNAPAWIANAEVFFKPHFLPGSRIGVEWQHINNYYTDNANTKTYRGYDLLNIRLGYRLEHTALKGLEWWCNITNVTDELYASTVLSGQYGDTYQASAPRTISIGVGYNFRKN